MCSTGRGSKRQRLSWGQPPKGVDVCEKGSRDGVVSLMVIHECSMSMYGPTTPTELPHVCPLSTKVDPGGEQVSETMGPSMPFTEILILYRKYLFLLHMQKVPHARTEVFVAL